MQISTVEYIVIIFILFACNLIVVSNYVHLYVEYVTGDL